MARNASTSSSATVFIGAVFCAPAGRMLSASAKVTMRPPLVFRNLRRVEVSSYISTTLSSNVSGGALHRSDNAEMCPAAAEIVSQGFLDFRNARVLRFREQRRCLDDHAADAEAALCGLFVDERLLHGRGFFRAAEAVKRNNAALGSFRERRLARKYHLAVRQHGA